MKIELRYLLRYASGGFLNTIFGFSVIFVAMTLGISPLVSNIIGYAIGLILGFTISKKFVFRTNGNLTKEGIRYFLAFFFAFICNLAVLKLCIISSQINVMAGQFAAMATYTTLMYLLTRFFVFGPKVPPSQ